MCWSQLALTAVWPETFCAFMSADATLAQFSNTSNVGLILHSFVQQWPRSEVPYVAAGFRNVHIAKHRTLPERPQINYSILRKIYFRHAWLQLSSRRELTVALGIIRVHILIQWIILPCTFCNVPSFRSASNYFIGKFPMAIHCTFTSRLGAQQRDILIHL